MEVVMNKIYQKECESSCEYSLPDYMGDVKKILTVSALAIPSGKFASDGEAEFSGVVSYELLYADSEGKLTRLVTSSDYDVSVPIDPSYVDSASDVGISNVAVRLTGPRKLTLKSVVSSSVKVSASDEVACGGSAFSEGNSPEVLTKTLSRENMIFASSAEREYAEEAEHLNGIAPDDIEIIATSGAVRILESVVGEGGVTVRGELIITSIVRTEEQPPFAIRKTVPFEETVTLEGLTPDMQVLSDGYLTSVTSGVAEDAEGSVITVNAIAELTCVAASNSEITVTEDAYLKNRDTVGEYENYSYFELVCTSSAESSFAVSVPRDELGLENTRNILTLGADVRSADKKIERTGFEISGDAAFSGIACEIGEDGSIAYSPVKFVAPYRINVNCGCQIPENAVIDCRASVIDVEHSLDSEKLLANVLVKVGYRVANPHSVKRMTTCNIVGENEYFNGKSHITVYYPEDNESLFSIAKKFHTTSEKLATDNKLSEPTLASGSVASAGIKKLIIR